MLIRCYDTENYGLLPTTSFDNEEQYASNLLYCALRIIHISVIHADSEALQYTYNILQPQPYHRTISTFSCN